jgi:hypothetical protein
MDDSVRLLFTVGAAGAALAGLGRAVVWFLDETRRIRRSLRKVLGGEPHALIVARGRGKGVGFDFAAHRLAVTWDGGAWCLVYAVEELVGTELVLDGQVSGRVHRGEPRRPLDTLSGGERSVRLRLLFSDPAYPDFDLDLWLAADARTRGALSSGEAVEEANRWLARTEAVFRRPLPRRGRPMVVPAPFPLDTGADSDGDEDAGEAYGLTS